MQNTNPIDVTLCRRIAYEEWKNFKKSQDMSIDAKLQKQTGLIHSGGAGRRYSITTNKYEIVASLVHPDYLRYQDMRKTNTDAPIRSYIRQKSHKQRVKEYITG